MEETIITMENNQVQDGLARIVEDIFIDTAKTPKSLFLSLAKAEEYLKQSYEGRYLFELIQNARDAAKMGSVNGIIHIALHNNTLKIYNNGQPFNAGGINSICRIGESEKHGQDFIGHKGIGFKSVREISDFPLIRTRGGSIVFDPVKTLDRLGYNLDPENVPLFFFPHYSPEALEAGEDNYETLIELPLKPDVNADKIIRDFKDIKAEQLVLLGNINRISFESLNFTTSFNITKRTTGTIEINTPQSTVYFKDLSPARPVTIPFDVISKSEKREKQTFESNPNTEIKIVLAADENKRFKPIKDAKLYLFYPLEIISGFRFLIHSYFSVNPERKNLRDTPINKFLLDQIAEYIGGVFVEKLKRTYAKDILSILCYQRPQGTKLTPVYDKVKSLLLKKEFIYDDVTAKYYRPDQVMIADDFDRELFPKGRFVGKRLIFIKSGPEQDWLTNELGIEYLDVNFITKNIEAECQRRIKDINFFKSLYKYISKYGTQFNLSGKKILLTNDGSLLSNVDDVFYGGSKSDLQLPEALSKDIHFIHRDITLPDQKEFRTKLGVKQFATDDLVSKLLKLYSKTDVPYLDIIQTLFKLVKRERYNASELKGKIKLTVTVNNTSQWVDPFETAIYFNTEELVKLYPNGHFVDFSKLITSPHDEVEWKRFAKDLGVWDIPGVYVAKTEKWFATNNNRYSTLASILQLRPNIRFWLKNDYHLDPPMEYSREFFKLIIENWPRYVEILTDGKFRQMSYRLESNPNQSVQINGNKRLEVSTMMQQLRDAAWIWIDGCDSALQPSQVLGIDRNDFLRSTTKLLKRYFNLLPIDYYSYPTLIDNLYIRHFSKKTAWNYTRILFYAYNHYKDGPPQEKEFMKAYNSLLASLFDYYQYTPSKDEKNKVIEYLSKDIKMLCHPGDESQFTWSFPKNIFYIDDFHFYKRLPEELGDRITPVFTNKDKGTFGRIANKIGIPLSRNVKREMEPLQQEAPIRLKDKFRFLPALIAYVEVYLDEPFQPWQLTMFKDAQVIPCEEISVFYNVTIDKHNARVEFKEDLYLTSNDNQLDLYLSDYGDVPNKTVADGLALVVERVSNLEDKRLPRDILRFIEHFEKGRISDLMLEGELSSERIEELSNKLNDAILDNRLEFWQAVIQALNMECPEPFYELGFDVLGWLKGIFESTEISIEDIYYQLNYGELNSEDNIPLIRSLLKLTSLSLKTINSKHCVKISFTSHYIGEFERLKQKKKAEFEGRLFSWLKPQPIEKKELYLQYINSYKSIPFSIEDEIIDNLQDAFDLLLVNTFDFYSELNTTPEISGDDINVGFFEAKENLQVKLTSEGIADFDLDLYLVSDKVRSLLYFNETSELFRRIQLVYKPVKSSQQPAEGKEPKSKTKSKEEPKTPITNYNSQSAPVTTPDNSNGKGTRKPGFGGGGYGHKRKDNEDIGRKGEEAVYRSLCALYDNVSWVSSNGYLAGEYPEGSDEYGYDIEYIDENGQKYFVEVKSTSGNDKRFFITRNELQKAEEAGEYYQIYYVTNVFDIEKREILNLGNIFMIDEEENFMNNSKFTATNETYSVTFR